MIEALMTPEAITVIVGGLMALVALIVKGALRRRIVALATYHAYHIAKTIGEEIPGKDPAEFIALVLERADDYMKANGWRPLKEHEKEAAAMMAQSIEGQTKVASKVASEAIAKELRKGSPQ